MRVNILGTIDDSRCSEVVRGLRWPDGVRCPISDSNHLVKQGRDDTERQSYEWRGCRRRFNDLTDPIVADHQQPLRVWVLCFLHGFLQIRDCCREVCPLLRRVWDVDRIATAEKFRRLKDEFQPWYSTQTGTASVIGMPAKLWNKMECYVMTHKHPGCHRTSNAVDRLMSRLCRQS